MTILDVRARSLYFRDENLSKKINFISQQTLRVWGMAGAIINLICMKIAIGRLSTKWEYGEFLKAKLTNPICWSCID